MQGTVQTAFIGPGAHLSLPTAWGTPLDATVDSPMSADGSVHVVAAAAGRAYAGFVRLSPVAVAAAPAAPAAPAPPPAAAAEIATEKDRGDSADGGRAEVRRVRSGAFRVDGGDGLRGRAVSQRNLISGREQEESRTCRSRSRSM